VIQRVTGTLSPGAHPGSYNGQDAYNDMFVYGMVNTENRRIQDVESGINTSGKTIQECHGFNRGGANASKKIDTSRM